MNYCLEGYHQPFTSTRTQKRGGGVAIYVTLDREAELFHADEYHESVSVKINDPKKRNSQFLVFIANHLDTKFFKKRILNFLQTMKGHDETSEGILN